MIPQNLGVLYAGPTIAGLVDLSSLVATQESDEVAIQFGQNDLDSWWERSLPERATVSPYGSHRSHASVGGRSPTQITTFEGIIAADTREGRVLAIDRLERQLRSGGDRTVFRVGDDERVAYGRLVRLRAFPSQPDRGWEHGDTIVQISVAFDDPSKYDPEPTVVELAADTPVEIQLGGQWSWGTFTVEGVASDPEFFAYEGGGVTPGAQYGHMALDIELGAGDSLSIDHENAELVLTPSGEDPDFEDSALPIGGGWFFTLGLGLGEESAWVECSVACTLTYYRRW